MFKKISAGRIWELDFFRGIALIFMVYFHLVYDMKEFFGYNVSYHGNLNYYIGKISAILFMLISGISTSLSRNSAKRGLKVLGAALVITLASFIYNKDYIIVFGILHFLGLSMVLSALTGKLNKYLLLASGAAVILLGYILPLDKASTNWFMMFGFRNQAFQSSDYYPLIPWYGVFLTGMSLGKLLYAKKQSLIKPFKGHKMIGFAGMYTLPVYFIHQPALLLALTLISKIK